MRWRRGRRHRRRGRHAGHLIIKSIKTIQTIQTIQKGFVPNVPEECQRLGYCNLPQPDYPAELVERLIKTLGLQNANQSVVDSIQPVRELDPQEVELCDFVERELIPLVAQDANGTWNFIINSNQYRQMFRVQICNAFTILEPEISAPEQQQQQRIHTYISTAPTQYLDLSIACALGNARDATVDNTLIFKKISRKDRNYKVGVRCSPVAYFPTGYKASCEQNFIKRVMKAIDHKGNIIETEHPIPSNCYCKVQQEKGRNNQNASLQVKKDGRN
ncbi:hypothetical protein MSG28_002662 [Choristoneura fumiferana]|uniref:Uncharacterized protein n=1 Tax=Choristoneura fumiferana TaxID=7141 RepID=A0ACC0JIQ7_CHOFU|nr:hypothetical protein MSG28_002662 [Choristoneura fumiferana]